jgi:hypothetical protein
LLCFAMLYYATAVHVAGAHNDVQKPGIDNPMS